MIEAKKFRTCFRENKLIFLRTFQGGLISCRPELASLSIANVAECSPVVTGGVFPPSGNGNTVPLTVTAAGVCNQHAVPAPVRKQLDFRKGRIGSTEHPQWHLEPSRGSADICCT